MKSLLFFGLLYVLYSNSGTFACFEEQPLDSSLQEYLELKKSCSETLFPEPSCCGVSWETKGRIINGTLPGLKELTWTVYISITLQNIETNLDDPYSCGGSLINPIWVLSAAHCFFDEKLLFVKGVVHIGEWDIKNSEPDCFDGFCAPEVVKVPIRYPVKHPDYMERYSNYPDLTLVRLEHPVKYSEFVNPICLPFSPLKKGCFENKVAIVSGWGRTVYNQPSSSKKLKTALTVLKAEECYEDTRAICASSVGTNSACEGDSGGPLSLKSRANGHYYLLGVVKGGYDNCSAKIRPNTFSRVDLKWVIDVILKEDARKSN